MPTTEPMTTGEIARALVSVNSKLDGISTELKDKPGQAVFNDYREQQNRIHAEQNQKIEGVEKRQDTKNAEQDTQITAINQRADKLLFAIIGTAMAAATNLITNIGGG